MINFRPVSPGDRGWLYEWSRVDYSIGRRFGVTKSFEAYWSTAERTVTRHWVVQLDGTAVGQCLCYRAHFELGFAHVAVDILQAYRGRGFLRESLRFVVEDSLDMLPLHKLYAHQVVPSGSAPDLGTEYQGFVLEGVLPRRERHAGVPLDLCYWGYLPNVG